MTQYPRKGDFRVLKSKNIPGGRIPLDTPKGVVRGMVSLQHFFPFIFWLNRLKSLSWLFVSFFSESFYHLIFYVYFCHPFLSFFHPTPIFHFCNRLFLVISVFQFRHDFLAVIFQLFKSFTTSLVILWEKHLLLFWLGISVVHFFIKKGSKKSFLETL